MASIKNSLKTTLLQRGDSCYYCNLKFGLNPIEEGQPYFQKLRSYARMILVPLFSDDRNDDKVPENYALAHHWCHNKAGLLSLEDKERFRQQLLAASSVTGALPWIDKKFLLRYLKQGGNLVSLMTNEALLTGNG